MAQETVVRSRRIRKERWQGVRGGPGRSRGERSPLSFWGARTLVDRASFQMIPASFSRESQSCRNRTLPIRPWTNLLDRTCGRWVRTCKGRSSSPSVRMILRRIGKIGGHLESDDPDDWAREEWSPPALQEVGEDALHETREEWSPTASCTMPWLTWRTPQSSNYSGVSSLDTWSLVNQQRTSNNATGQVTGSVVTNKT